MRKFTIALALALALVAILTGPAAARMYQWTQPDTGRVQLSGTPPAWYRAAEPGPRVFVFDDGLLIDDTAIPVSESQRVLLREEALGAAAAELAPAEDHTGHIARRAQQAHAAGLDVTAINAELEAEQAALAAAAADTAPVADDAQALELKSLIEAFDQRRLEQARALLERLPPAPAAQ